jgi:thiamine biosynthesis lipoprotein
LYSGGDESTLDAAFDLCREYEGMFSRSLETSDVSRINRAGGEFTDVAPETIELLRKSAYYGELTGGVFDVTSGAVTELWDFKSESPEPPEAAAIGRALDTVGFRQIEFSGDRVRLANPGARLDLGGVAKGYIADKIGDYLRDAGASGIIDLGGDILAVGAKPDGKPWSIGIKRPFSLDIAAKVYVMEKAIISSGVYERNFEYNGEFYHHIIDLKTGAPAKSGVSAVTIVSGEAAIGDALGTAALCLGIDAGLSLIEGIDGAEAAFFADDGSIVLSSGMDDYIR